MNRQYLYSHHRLAFFATVVTLILGTVVALAIKSSDTDGEVRVDPKKEITEQTSVIPPIKTIDCNELKNIIYANGIYEREISQFGLDEILPCLETDDGGYHSGIEMLALINKIKFTKDEEAFKIVKTILGSSIDCSNRDSSLTDEFFFRIDALTIISLIDAEFVDAYLLQLSIPQEAVAFTRTILGSGCEEDAASSFVDPAVLVEARALRGLLLTRYEFAVQRLFQGANCAYQEWLESDYSFTPEELESRQRNRMDTIGKRHNEYAKGLRYADLIRTHGVAAYFEVVLKDRSELLGDDHYPRLPFGKVYADPNAWTEIMAQRGIEALPCDSLDF